MGAGSFVLSDIMASNLVMIERLRQRGDGLAIGDIK